MYTINSRKNSRCEAETILLPMSRNYGETHQRFTMYLNLKGNKCKS